MLISHVTFKECSADVMKTFAHNVSESYEDVWKTAAYG